ncbi:hypothetical protein [Pseudocitrobacter corydidari]|uniref:TLDc domain-containing protein n=1 Tax=Pseudocitrobacter corydidari TaxID=2891570 RepID=A0ABY3SCA1_9ENTR|nr:hypothetical protein [Pseudocitrobacter corydidari]UGS43559.1 hypothetical protein G163CM_43370 [Pseudocitrobacter corydidari]
MLSYENGEPNFHDNLIRGVSFASNMDSFDSELYFDIDHIIQWVKCSPNENESLFLISRGILKFHNVSDLCMNISWGDTQYKQYSGYQGGLYISDIKKELVSSSLGGSEEYYRWDINTNNKDSIITFGASSFSLELLGNPLTVNRQYLLNNERCM